MGFSRSLDRPGSRDLAVLPGLGEIGGNRSSVSDWNGDALHGSLIAFKLVTGAAGTLALEPAWVSNDMNLPDPPVVANGVVFAVATGENPRQDRVIGMHYRSMDEWRHNLLTTAERSAGTRPAVLMAFDAKTGKLLYQSGDAMKSWVHFSGLAVTGGRVFAVDHESRLYCFGLKGVNARL